MSARRRVLVPLLLLVLVLLLAELAAQAFVLPNRTLVWRPLPPFGRLATAEQRAWLAEKEREIATGAEPVGYGRFDPDLGWTNRPSSASPDGKVHVNARGLRGPREYADEIPPGVRRIAVCGDSFTFCEEVADAEAWPARVEERAPGLELWNYGVGGYGTDQALLRLQREARGRFDALVVGLLLENIGRNVNRYRPLWFPSAHPAAKPRFVLRAGGLELVPLPFAAQRELVEAVRTGAVLERLAEHEYWGRSFVPRGLEWSACARLVAGRRAYAARSLRTLWSDTEGEPFRTTLALLEAFRPEARELGTEQLLVLVFPTRAELALLLADGERTWETLLAALEARGIPALDLSGPLAAAARADGGVGAVYLENHLSPRGNEVVAEALVAWLAQEELLPRPK